MSDLKDDVEYYQEVLDDIGHILCDAMDRDTEYYDRDQADGECYKDCAKDAAEMITGERQHFVEQACAVGEKILKDPDRFPSCADWELKVADAAIRAYQQAIRDKFNHPHDTD